MIFQNFGFNRQRVSAAAPTTTTTSTTTVAPIVYPAGAYAIFDFGNPASYSGTGATVYDVSGNSNNGTLVNSPTWTSTNGGILRLNNASSQRIDYGASFTPNTSTAVIWKNFNSDFTKDTGVPTFRGSNGYMLSFLGNSGREQTPILFNSGGSGNTFGGASYATADITIWHQYGMTVSYNAGSIQTTANTYLDGGTLKGTETKSFARSGTGTGTAYVGFDNAVGDRYANGYIMAYLHYNSTLNSATMTDIYNVFSSRF